MDLAQLEDQQEQAVAEKVIKDQPEQRAILRIDPADLPTPQHQAVLAAQDQAVAWVAAVVPADQQEVEEEAN